MTTRFPILNESLSNIDLARRDILDVNTETLSSLRTGLGNENPAKPAQARLIVGEAGSGKTFLLARLLQSINTEMTEHLEPITIEGKRIFSSADIWSECTRSLDFQDINAYEGILNWQSMNHKRIVLLIDDIEYYFGRSDKTDQYALRGKLNKAGGPILVASCDKVLPDFTDYDAPFFDGLMLHYLRPVELGPLLEIAELSYDATRIERLMTYLPSTIRSVIVAAEIIRQSEDQSQDLIYLVDHFHLFFKEVFDSLTVQVQRILITLASADTGLTLAGIRNAVHQENGKISPYLKLMIDSKVIRKNAKTPRGSIYLISDPLFKLWLQIEIFGKA